ncbi:hypothetical protein [Brevundimonas diminuta]|uniref:hypothetical protein n=1 Tax=Brevundimonas diminuta TaxID=293 RepID=UPI003D070038
MFIQKLKSTTAVLGVVMFLGACASQDTRIRLQQPPQPTGQAMLVPIRHPLRNAVVIDYVSGMSQHSYFFAEANQNAYRPLLQQALDKSGMAARTPLAGRYGLQVEFEDLRGSFFGVDFDSRSRATYRIVERATGRVMFEEQVDAGFKARFIGLVEEDLASTYWLTMGVAAIGLAQAASTDVVGQSQAWRRAYQATLWSMLFAPLSVALPTNLVAPNDFFGRSRPPRPHMQHGDLSTEGYGARDGYTRGQQADHQMMRQSIAKFVIGLAEQQDIPLTVILPCDHNIEVENLKVELSWHGIPYRGENCRMERVEIIH